MNRRTFLLSLFCLVLVTHDGLADEPKPRFEQRWFYAAYNLLVDKNADDLIALIERAGKAGYNGLVLADYKFNILGRMPPRYFHNVARVQKAAEAAKIEIIPAVFPIGYSAGLLAHDPNLAEGVPVKDAPFVVKGREAVLEPTVTLRNGDLEQTNGDRFIGFGFQDEPGKRTVADRETVHGGKVSCRIQDGPSVNGRVSQRVKVRPHGCYRFSAWVKTDDFKKGHFQLLALGTATWTRPLTFFETHLKPTQDWTQVEAVFNSLEESEVTLMAGIWGSQTGTLWLDDLHLEEVSLVNVLRREGCPLRVASEDGATLYEEGKDFLPVRDPKLGQTPYSGEFNYRHAGGTIQLTENSRIKDGAKLKVSWYHPILTHEYQVMCCLTEPKVYDLLRDQAKRVNDMLKPQTFFMSHDEIRVAGWCEKCLAAKQTPGQLLAANVGKCVPIIKEVNPKARIIVWSDMFDPHHNAVEKYYLVNGPWTDSWKGLPAEVMIANWNGGKGAASLKWFADRGHAQVIAGYYDGANLDNFKKWDAAAKDMPNVTGFMYTTWQHKYDLLEAYGKAMLGRE
ncbi:hypothetical protein AYO44_00210 [Planctomycetaceae bacterium SCGC AG-212-F19]|nr:hypothetical protein AYO44_00210 [Planctomycetaceae bacterium SCGC AG-212-F19]